MPVVLLAVPLLPAALADPLGEILHTAGVHPFGLAADERADAVAFAVALERELVAAGAEPLELAYVYLGALGRALPEHRELALAEVPLAAGRPDLSALLTPERLEALFGHR